MTAFKYVALSVLIAGMVAPSATAAPVNSTSGAWWWWSPSYASMAANNTSASSFATSFYAPASTNTNVLPPSAVPLTSAALLAPSPVPIANANLNLGTGPYPLASVITTGNSQPWYTSPQITGLFGGQPTAQQISSFDNVVLQRVEQTFQQSGVPINLTLNSTAPALHTLSLVSGTTSNTTPGVIGMTQVGGSGFSFIDQEAKSAQSLDQLQWIVAHNISHELMLAFGVGENYDQTGNYIDARNANWSMMVSPGSAFSQGAAQALQAALASNGSAALTNIQGAQLLDGKPVPEPATLACWTLGLAAAAVLRRKPRQA